jgi:outer membrane lipoprotein-sorting protein
LPRALVTALALALVLVLVAGCATQRSARRRNILAKLS